MTKRERLAAFNGVQVDQVCCHYCDKKSKKEGKIYCPWLRVNVKNPKEDYCTFFLSTQR